MTKPMERIVELLKEARRDVLSARRSLIGARNLASMEGLESSSRELVGHIAELRDLADYLERYWPESETPPEPVELGTLKPGDLFTREGTHPTWRSPWRVMALHGKRGRVEVEKVKSGATNALYPKTLVLPVKEDV